MQGRWLNICVAVRWHLQDGADGIRNAANQEQRDQVVEKAVAQLLDMTAESGDVQPVHINELLPAYMDTVQKRMEGDESTRNLLTGIVDLDNATGGINPQDLIVVAGRPGMGKTEFALTVVEGVTAKGGGALILAWKWLLLRLLNAHWLVPETCLFPVCVTSGYVR
jgi:replicative DNA helicase